MAKFSEKKELFAQGKALGRSNKDLSRELNVTEKTCSAWGKDPIVQAKIQEYLLQHFLESQSVLLSFQAEAAKTLIRLLASQNESIKLKSAAILLNLCASFPEYL